MTTDSQANIFQHVIQQLTAQAQHTVLKVYIQYAFVVQIFVMGLYIVRMVPMKSVFVVSYRVTVVYVGMILNLCIF